MSATTSSEDIAGPVLSIGGRDWECRPTMPATLANAVVRVAQNRPAANRQRRRVADSFYRKFIRRQVISGFELLRAVEREPDLWPDVTDKACVLALWYIDQERVT